MGAPAAIGEGEGSLEDVDEAHDAGEDDARAGPSGAGGGANASASAAAQNSRVWRRTIRSRSNSSRR